MASPTPDPLPVGLGVEIDRAVRLTDEGHVLVGGSPPRALRLPPEGVSAVIRWLSGAAPGHLGERRLARVLVQAGLAHPRPAPVPPGQDVQLALTGRAAPAELERALDRIGREHPDLRPVVVGATGETARVARRRGLRVVEGPSGGAGARAVALGACDAGIVALLDTGAEPEPGWLDVALGHFADPGVAAVLPRLLPVRRRCGHGAMAAAALHAQAVDRGADPAPVLPWGRPAPPNEHASADPPAPVRALLVRRGAAELDPSLGAGAEAEMLWRLAEEGWSVRYEPRSKVRVPMPTGLCSYLRARFEAGAAAGPLARRHGRRAVGPELSLPGALGLGLVLAGRPVAGLAVCAVGGAMTARTMRSGAAVPLADTVRPAAADLVHTARTGVRVARTVWWPVVAAVAVGGAVSRVDRSGGVRVPGRWALAAGAVLTVPHLVSWRRRHGAALVGPIAWTGMSAAGDAARSLGTWWGAARARSPAPLLPRRRPPVSATSLVSSQVERGSVGQVRKPAPAAVVSGG
ncbi:family 2 glycosyl transferase [Nocardiopsis terrae]